MAPPVGRQDSEDLSLTSSDFQLPCEVSTSKRDFLLPEHPQFDGVQSHGEWLIPED